MIRLNLDTQWMKPLHELLPVGLIDVLRDRYKAGVADAEYYFSSHESDEDSLTGALGQAISLRPIHFSEADKVYWVEITYKKIRGRGLGAPEKKYGVDGLFQIEVYDEDTNVIFNKALPFQSKTRWKGRNKALLEQCKVVESIFGDGLVIDYAPDRYYACSAAAVVKYDGSRPRVNAVGAMRPLGQVLGGAFLDCTIGRLGVSYDSTNEQFNIPEEPHHLITTKVVAQRKY